MVILRHASTIVGGDFAHLAGISSLTVAEHNGQVLLFSGSAATGGLTAFRLAEGEGAAVVQQLGYAPGQGTLGVCGLEVAEIAGRCILIPSARYDAGFAFHEIGAGGGFQTVTNPQAGASGGGRFVATVTLDLGGTSAMFGSVWGQSGLQRYTVNSDLTLSFEETLRDSPALHLNDITALAGAEAFGRSFVFAASGFEAGLSCFEVRPSGRLSEIASFGAQDGLGIAAPSALATAQVAGRLFVVMASAGSDSLSVVQVRKNGSAKVRDHVTDTLESRFEGVQAIDTVSINGRCLVLAGGADDGVSVFELAPDGRLMLLTSVSDGWGTTLSDITAIAAHLVGNEVQVFVTGAESGITQFTLDLGNFGALRTGSKRPNDIHGGAGDDLILGRGGMDVLHGGRGDDRLVDGPGFDVLTGGPGDDIFSFRPDGRLDKVTDFTLGHDRIDLSAFDRLYSMDQLSITPKGYGFMIRFRDEKFRIETDDHHKLLPHDLTPDHFIF